MDKWFKEGGNWEVENNTKMQLTINIFHYWHHQGSKTIQQRVVLTTNIFLKVSYMNISEMSAMKISCMNRVK